MTWIEDLISRSNKVRAEYNVDWGAALDVDAERLDRMWSLTAEEGEMPPGSRAAHRTTFADEIAFITDHPDYGLLAGNILASELAEQAPPTFGAYVRLAYANRDEATKEHTPLVSRELYDAVQENEEAINAQLRPERDLFFDYFALKTLLNGKYLVSQFVTRVAPNGVSRRTMLPIETPQFLMMRVALGINMVDRPGLYGGDWLANAFELYGVMSQRMAIHATPTLFNAGTVAPQLASCFLLDTRDDSIEGIFDTVKQCAVISKNAGGIGISVDRVRSEGSYIRSTRGTSNGLVPMLKVFNSTARFCDQGGGKRKGSFAVYLSPYHPDIMDWLDLKKNTGSEERRARDLFFALWVPDVFMRRVQAAFEPGGEGVLWTLVDPAACPGLHEVYGQEFEEEYRRIEADPARFVRQVPVRELWIKILESQLETGTPYMLYKDHINRKSNQKNLGVVRSSNLCAEICQVTSREEVAVCNLASVSLPAMVRRDGASGRVFFDWERLQDVTRIMVRSLDRVIDATMYPVPEARTSNKRHRPVGLGIQGLADVFCLLGLDFESPEAMEVNRQIAEAMYFAALDASSDLAFERGPYSTLHINGGAPVSHGIFQQDMWAAEQGQAVAPSEALGLDWKALRVKVREFGVRNSLLIAHMPTASTSQILGNAESFEPYFGNIFSRKTKSGEFFCFNRHMVRHLKELGLWTTRTDPRTGRVTTPLCDEIMRRQGSIKDVASIPSDVRKLYKTSMDISLRTLTLMSRDRGRYVDQSASTNVHYHNKDNMMGDMTKYHCWAWKLGLKTGSYYTRTIQKTKALEYHADRAGSGPGGACAMSPVAVRDDDDTACESCSA